MRFSFVLAAVVALTSNTTAVEVEAQFGVTRTTTIDGENVLSGLGEGAKRLPVPICGSCVREGGRRSQDHWTKCAREVILRVRNGYHAVQGSGGWGKDTKSSRTTELSDTRPSQSQHKRKKYAMRVGEV
ncbi:hypothetical protein EV702DRAFT_1268900 [Suillus placidus]|uniref:Uncharacterized protein n=1 Tax=Suillus placidus TaxID=48579 RepID=A0A9P7D1B2_9AGAM|nr:hypothetical protein EV702DRAFT_1268900 [Suillus placidus]